jgi:hypothetical protein
MEYTHQIGTDIIDPGLTLLKKQICFILNCTIPRHYCPKTGVGPGGPGPHRRIPNLLPVKPFPIIQGNPNNHGGHNSYAPPMNNYGPQFNGPPTVVELEPFCW